MKDLPMMLTTDQMEHIQAYLEERFGEPADRLMHELESRFVHTDVAIHTSSLDEPTFVTFGMSARPTDAVLKEFTRTELVMYTSPAFDLDDSRKLSVIGGELQRLARFPFANDTWFGAGHTVTASEVFKETFGYDAFLLVYGGDVYTAENGNEVRFLMLVPLYDDEREHIMTHGHTGFLHAVFDANGNGAFYPDVAREPIAAEQAAAVCLEDILDVDQDAVDELRRLLEDAAARGEEVSDEELARWVQAHCKD